MLTPISPAHFQTCNTTASCESHGVAALSRWLAPPGISPKKQVPFVLPRLGIKEVRPVCPSRPFRADKLKNPRRYSWQR